MKPEVVIDTPTALARVFADRFTAEACAAIAARGRFSCALPGGRAEQDLRRLGKVAAVEAGQGATTAQREQP